MQLIPVNGRVAVERLASERATRGGIVLPDEAKRANDRARVLAVSGPWTDARGVARTTRLAPDMIVLMNRYSGQEYELDGRRKVTLIAEDDLLAVEEATPA